MKRSRNVETTDSSLGEEVESPTRATRSRSSTKDSEQNGSSNAKKSTSASQPRGKKQREPVEQTGEADLPVAPSRKRKTPVSSQASDGANGSAVESVEESPPQRKRSKKAEPAAPKSSSRTSQKASVPTEESQQSVNEDNVSDREQEEMSIGDVEDQGDAEDVSGTDEQPEPPQQKPTNAKQPKTQAKPTPSAPLHPDTMKWLHELIDGNIPSILEKINPADRELAARQAIELANKLKEELTLIRTKPRVKAIPYSQMSAQLEKVRQTIKIESELLQVMQEEESNQRAEIAADKLELVDFRKKSRGAERRRNRLFERKLHPLLQNDDEEPVDDDLIGPEDGASEDEDNQKRQRERRREFILSQDELDIPRADPTLLHDESRFHPDPPALDPNHVDVELEKLKTAICRKLDKIDEIQKADEFMAIHSKICRVKEKVMKMINTIDPAKAQKVAFGSL